MTPVGTAAPDVLAVAEAVRRAAELGVELSPAAAAPAGDPTAAPADDLAELLVAGGVPEHAVPALARALTEHLGPDAGEQLAADPWRLLAAPSVRPEQADAYARARLGAGAGPGDARRARALVTRLLERAAADGHTMLPATTVLRALPALGVPDPDAALAAAVADGSVLALEGEAPGEGEPQLLLALDRWAMAEDAVAEAIARLLATARHLCTPEPLAALAVGSAAAAIRAAATSGVSVASARTAAAARDAVAGLGALAAATGVGMCLVAPTVRSARAWRACGVLDAAVAITTGPGAGVRVGAAGLVVVADAGGFDAEELAVVLDAAADGAHLVLVGDPGGLAGSGAGDVLADIAACGFVPVAPVRDGAEFPGALDRLAAALATGVLPPPEALNAAGARDVVVVPARSDAEVAHRVAQLVTDSIPRALGIPSSDVVVLSPRRDGEAGVDALDARLRTALGERPAPDGAGAPWAASPVAAADVTWPAVVLVLPASAAGSLSRDLLACAVARADLHLSVVTAAGPALERAVATRPRRPRSTRLPQLLAEALGG